ncbi:Protein spire [Amphibalanus amphitrite]|uniref:Protein spire n=1 Tax=Amphibalanus amphitrite TaxID=1232801 RepID=A0A6A4VUU5_AMPAM|nr:Protein spire [Amphibalanus amphitrite]
MEPSAGTAVVETAAIDQREPIPPTPPDSLSSDDSGGSGFGDNASLGSDDREPSQEDGDPSEQPLGASDGDLEASDDDDPAVTARDDPETAAEDGSLLGDVQLEQDDSQLSERDRSDSVTPGRGGMKGSDGDGPTEDRSEDLSESDWGDADGTDPALGPTQVLNISETEPAERAGFDADAGETVSDDAAARGGTVTVPEEASSPAVIPPRSEVVPAETIAVLERTIVPPLTPDSLSSEEGEAGQRTEDKAGDAEEQGTERIRVGVDSGLVRDNDVEEAVSGVPVGTVKDDPPAAAPQSGRRLIKADPSLAVPCSTTFDDDDDDPDFPETPATPYCPEPAPRDGLGLGYRTGGTGTGSGSGCGSGSGISGPPSHWQHNMALDLATQRVSFKSDRRHTLCEPPMSRSRPGSALSDRSSGSEETPLPHQPGSHVASELQRQFLASSQWSDMDCLSLTLDEVVHIRSVLTKAELDSLPVECHIKEDVARGKLCFLCMKTRFSFFGAKGNNCRLCQRVVCAKCCAKMRIPTEHFASIPVYTLTPSSLSPQEEEARSLLSRLQVPELPNFTSSGSGGSPTSPANSRDSPEQQCQSLPPQPLLQQVESKLRRTRLYRSRTLARPEDLESPRSSEGDRDELGGVLMTVCKDCKAMVLHIIGTWKKRRDRSKRASAPARPRSLFIAAVR